PAFGGVPVEGVGDVADVVPCEEGVDAGVEPAAEVGDAASGEGFGVVPDGEGPAPEVAEECCAGAGGFVVEGDGGLGVAWPVAVGEAVLAGDGVSECVGECGEFGDVLGEACVAVVAERGAGGWLAASCGGVLSALPFSCPHSSHCRAHRPPCRMAHAHTQSRQPPPGWSSGSVTAHPAWPPSLSPLRRPG